MDVPLILHQLMGIPPPPPPKRSKRNHTLSDSLPATFNLNWDYCENGSSQPQTRDGYITWMGPPASTEAGCDLSWQDCAPTCLLRSVQLLRERNFEIQVIPDNYDENKTKDELSSFEERDDEDEATANTDPEYCFLSKSHINALKVYKRCELKKKNKKKKGNKDEEEKVLVATMTTISVDHPWLIIECCHTEETANTIGELLEEEYYLAKLPHVTQNNIPIMLRDGRNNNALPGYQLVATTGSTPGNVNLTTLFVLSKIVTETTSNTNNTNENNNTNNNDGNRTEDKNKKVVGKVLCSYQNKEMDSVGPTIELFEIAEQWQGHGLGSALLRAIQSWFCGIFCHDGIDDDEVAIRFSVCYVTSAYASQWFQKHRFRDLDGMGEELGKELLHPDVEDDIMPYWETTTEGDDYY